MTDTQVTWLTQEAYDRLKAELDQLIANRPIIAAEINDRREEGDLRENGGYHAAREEQGQQEARIRQLQELLNNAKVGEAPKQSGVALPGSVVKVVLRRRQVRHRDLPDRHPAGRRQRRQARGVLAELAAGRRADRRQGRRDPHLHGAQRQHRQGHPGQRRAIPLLTRPAGAVALQSGHGADRRGPVSAAAGQRVCAARPGPCAPRAGAVRGSAAGPGAAPAGSGRRWPGNPSKAAGWWRSPGPGRWIRSSSRRFGCCSSARCARPPRYRNCASTPRRTSPSYLEQTGQIRRIRLQTRRFNQPYAWPLTNRDRVDPARAALLSALFDRHPPTPSTAAIVSLLHAVDGLGALLSLNDRGWRWVHAAGRRNRQRQLG